MDKTPASLLERLRQPGQAESVNASWQRFVDLYTPLLYYWARRMGLHESDAADLVQDVFALLVQKLPEFSYDRHKSFRGWLRTVLTNKRFEHVRRRQPPAQTLPFEPVSPDDPDEVWEAEYRQHVVGRALQVMQQEFAPATWKACWEAVVNDRSAADVGRELGMSEGAVRAAKFRVLCRLRQELARLLE